ncbi:hypothetical protein O1611_g4626 [Lasiodiplodia mahajangana]|uniref:Uncharacterized protein n=1 Tax=Lasiodiplodia mahajangana TaxID=1108764 RepID=A0ACC2JNB9_9PEZI|nr:hypothetical protein O1611_g4626 [Lasiodiplodia mahajangana]
MAGLKAYPQLLNQRSIRVIRLYGAADAGEVICFDLIPVSLDESPPPSYEALSYTWGGQPLDQVVYANGEESFVTKNAKAAMKKLRPPKPVATVGRPASFTSLRREANVFDSVSQDYRDLKRRLRAGIADIASREYWERAWTVQEAAVNPSCFVFCGSSEPLRIETFILGHLVVGLFYMFYGIEAVYLPYRLHLHSESVYASTGIELNERALNSTCAKKATVEVDRIFALRAMFPHSLGSLRVDYSQPARDVYTDAARLLLTTTQRVMLLRYACRADRDDGFPSWVPAWNDPPNIPVKLCSCAPARISEKSIISEGGDKQVLRLKGLRVDRATANVSKMFPTVPPLEVPWFRSIDLVVAGEAFAIFRAWVEETWDANGVVPKLGQFASLLAGIFNLKADQVCEWFPRIWEEADFGTGQKWGYLLAPREVHDARIFTREFLQLVSGRSLFLTTSGRVGMSTLTVREGDEVALLTGEQLPYLIRKCPSQLGKYTLVAPCWISGAANGETWLSKSGDELLEDLEYIELL